MSNRIIIGYTLYGQDNDSFMWDGDAHPYGEVCAQCGFIKDFNTYHNPFFRLKRKTYDFSQTYDIGHIVSLKFKEFCLREKYDGLIFKEFEREPNFYQLMVTNVVQFDMERRKPDLFEYCPVCQNYNEAKGSLPAFLKNEQLELNDGIYRTDLFFGEGNKKHPLLIIAPKTADKLKREKMKGIVLESI